MAIQFSCPCGCKLQVADKLAGKPVRCPKCYQVSNASSEPGTSLDQPAPGAPAPPMRLAQPSPRGASRTRDVPAGRVSKLSIAGLVVSGGALYLGDLIGSLSIAVVGCLLGAVISIVAWIRVRASGGKLRGSEFATSGLLIGIGGAASGILLLLVGLLFIVALIYFVGQFVDLIPKGPNH